MFRIAKQLEITRLIHKCETSEELCQWFTAIVNLIGVQQGRTIIANAFLKRKAQFDSQSIDHLLTSIPTELYEEDRLGNNKINDSSDREQTISKHNKAKCELGSLPEGVFFHISLYLSIKSCLHLSMTSHSFHKKIQNNKCFYTKPKRVLNFTPITLERIVKNNCIMECTHMSADIDISTTHNCQYSHYNCNNCPLSRLIDKIDDNNKRNINYDLLWFKKIWKNMTGIYISNHYRCALEHIPISWVLEQDLDRNQFFKPIDVFSAASQEQKISRRRRKARINKEIIENFCKRVKKFVNDNPDKEIRKIQRIWYDQWKCDPIEIHLSFGNSLTGIILDLPRVWDNKCRFKNLDAFFKVFHQNLNWFEVSIGFDDFGNGDIISQFFKENKQLCDDLNKTEEKLSFGQFRAKYNFENKLMAQIKDFAIGLNTVPHEESVLFKLLHHDKMLKLLNVQESVNCLWFTFKHTCPNHMIRYKSNIENLNQLAFSKLDNLEKCRYNTIQDRINESQMTNFFRLANEFLLRMMLKPKGKYVWLLIRTPKWKYAKTLNYTIKIENKQELLYCNRDALRKKISTIVENSVEAAKIILHTNHLIKIEQRFQIERCYSI